MLEKYSQTLLEAVRSGNRAVKLTIEAVAVIAGGISCAVVTHAEPPVAAPRNWIEGLPERDISSLVCVCDGVRVR